MCICDVFITYLSEATRRNLSAVLMILQMVGVVFGVTSSVIGYYLKVTNVEMEGLVFETLMETMPEFLFYNGFVMGFMHIISFQGCFGAETPLSSDSFVKVRKTKFNKNSMFIL
ncbi:hypothetical protein HELRODRAFT_159048 [Helobdella robusta]|uniref:Uncharacterized protein n=1 Tax=Helobdella robusta TaxID=6412 RepID=T1ENI8_HELRO|nr:hypothetical protein HELRODRAFT_159048 [Helobdella robusta]ESO12500.1 hypothetical protein HELRODRAFT_159048 [Helobdella robusta]